MLSQCSEIFALNTCVRQCIKFTRTEVQEKQPVALDSWKTVSGACKFLFFKNLYELELLIIN